MPNEGDGASDEGHIGEERADDPRAAPAGGEAGGGETTSRELTAEATGESTGESTGDPCVEGEGLRALAQLLRLLCEETRLRILFTLAGGERDVSGLWGPMGLPQATVSHHLSFLRLANLVSTRRQGKHIHYRLGPGAKLVAPGVLSIECPSFALRLELRGNVPRVTQVTGRSSHPVRD